MTSRLLRLLAGLAFVAATMAGPASAAAMKAPPRPAAVVAALYAEEQAGRAPLSEPGERAAKLTASLGALWAQAEAASRRRGDEMGPLEFDVATNSQGASVKSDAIVVERLDARRATIAVTIEPDNWLRHSPEENVVRYDMGFDGARWAIDDIRSVAGLGAWSLRALLSHALKDP